MGIPGDFVELGVWRGGVCIYAKALIDILCQTDRNVLIFDAFEKLPGYGGAENYLSVSEESVRNSFDLYGVSTNGVAFFKGLFKETFPIFRKERIATGSTPIAILRIDGNFYDSHQDCLYNLYDFVSVGGIVIFDDFTDRTPNQAWQDFQTD
jgi:O-methyltransferase